MSKIAPNSFSTREYVVKILLLFALVLGTAYWFGALARSGYAFELLIDIPRSLVIVWKSICTGLLVAACWLIATSRVRIILASGLSTIWIADIALALGYVTIAGVIFVIAHMLAILAYSYARDKEAFSYVRLFAAVSIPVLTLSIVFVATLKTNISVMLLLFPLFSACVASVAVLSRFSIWLCGCGTLIFVLSDITFVIASNNVGEANSVGWLVWLTYFMGLWLIATGIVSQWIKETNDLVSR